MAWLFYFLFWDYAFVEIAEVGTDNWTTLSDANGLTTQSTGESCLEGWVDQIHPFLANYMDATCNPSGNTGEWHAFTGNSSGWQQVVMDLSADATSLTGGNIVEAVVPKDILPKLKAMGFDVSDVPPKY